MRARAKLIKKYELKTGVSKNTGQEWRSQRMKFELLRDDGSPAHESIIADCMDVILLDAPALAEGATGWLTFYLNVNEYTQDNTAKEYQRIRVSHWDPITAAYPQSPQQQAPATTPPQQQTAPAAEKKDDLPF